MPKNFDIEAAREWLLENCPATHTRHTLERALEYAAAVDRAGMCLNTIDGEGLYRFLTSPEAESARHRELFEATL